MRIREPTSTTAQFSRGADIRRQGIEPLLARRDWPVTLLDVVQSGATLSELFKPLRAWIDEERQP